MSIQSSPPRESTAGHATAASEDWDVAERDGSLGDPIDEERSRERLAERSSTLALADMLALVDTALHIAVNTPNAEHQLAVYLEEIQEQLTRWHSRHMSLNLEVDRLNRRLEEAAATAAKERQALVEQQDQFLGTLLDDHERGVEALRDDCERAWRKVSELQAQLRSGKAGSYSSDQVLKVQQELPREVLLRAKQQRDEAQRQTVEALSRLDSAVAELEQLRALVTPSTLPPGPEIPISLPPDGHLRAAPVPDIPAPPSPQPTGWRRSVPPIRRDSSSFTGGQSPIEETDALRKADGLEETPSPATSADTEPPKASRRLPRSDLPAVAPPAALPESPEAPSGRTEADPAQEDNAPASRRSADPRRETRGSYSLTLDTSSPPPGRRRPQ